MRARLNEHSWKTRDLSIPSPTPESQLRHTGCVKSPEETVFKRHTTFYIITCIKTFSFTTQSDYICITHCYTHIYPGTTTRPDLLPQRFHSVPKHVDIVLEPTKQNNMTCMSSTFLSSVSNRGIHSLSLVVQNVLRCHDLYR